MDSRFQKTVVVSTAALLVALVAPLRSAYAGEPSAQEKETARSLMDQADERFDQKDYQAALNSYLGAHAIMRVPTTALEVAKAHEALGHLVEARDALLEAGRYPQAAGEPAAYTTARVNAMRHAGELGDRIPSILVKVEGLPNGAELHVSIDRVALPPAAALLPIKVNPGAHQIVVSSDATYDASKDVVLKERDNVSIPFTLTIRPASDRSGAGGSSTRRTLHTAGLIGAGVGIAGLAVGTVFGLQASSKQSDAGCPSNVCKDEASAEMLRSANDAATISTIAFIAGGMLTAAGITLWLLTPERKDADSKSARADGVRIRLSPSGPSGPSGPFGVVATGTF